MQNQNDITYGGKTNIKVRVFTNAMYLHGILIFLFLQIRQWNPGPRVC
jgi:hypothetical protein